MTTEADPSPIGLRSIVGEEFSQAIERASEKNVESVTDVDLDMYVRKYNELASYFTDPKSLEHYARFIVVAIKSRLLLLNRERLEESYDLSRAGGAAELTDLEANVKTAPVDDPGGSRFLGYLIDPTSQDLIWTLLMSSLLYLVCLVSSLSGIYLINEGSVVGQLVLGKSLSAIFGLAVAANIFLLVMGGFVKRGGALRSLVNWAGVVSFLASLVFVAFLLF